MNVLVIGNGGREHAICKKLRESEKLDELHCIGGNGGTSRYAVNVSLDMSNHDEVVTYALEHGIELCVVGPEVPLCMGLADALWEAGVKVFGPKKIPAQLEGSKDFAKEFMMKYEIPTAKYVCAHDRASAVEMLKDFSYPLVIKADGLCAGKGVKICEDEASALEYLEQVFDEKIFGNEGSKVVIEEFLKGIEASLMCFVTSSGIIHMESAKDYKRIYDGDKGDNTGGVGCYSPSPLFDEDLKSKLHGITERIFEGFVKENIVYTGILFIGFMIDEGNPKVLEFNVRFGDPETEVVLPRLRSDFIEVMEKALSGELKEEDLLWDERKCMTVVLTSGGYPAGYEKGKLITGLEKVDKGVYVYHNNTKRMGEDVFSDGGRVLSVTTLGEDFEEMRTRVYSNIGRIHFDGMQYRKDIALIY